jgi:hypothetical protein
VRPLQHITAASSSSLEGQGAGAAQRAQQGDTTLFQHPLGRSGSMRRSVSEAVDEEAGMRVPLTAENSEDSVAGSKPAMGRAGGQPLPCRRLQRWRRRRRRRRRLGGGGHHPAPLASCQRGHPPWFVGRVRHRLGRPSQQAAGQPRVGGRVHGTRPGPQQQPLGGRQGDGSGKLQCSWWWVDGRSLRR